MKMTSTAPMDHSNGYETISDDFISIRSKSNTGVSTVRNWTKYLSRGGAVLDLGCGHGMPISELSAPSVL